MSFFDFLSKEDEDEFKISNSTPAVIDYKRPDSFLKTFGKEFIGAGVDLLKDFGGSMAEMAMKPVLKGAEYLSAVDDIAKGAVIDDRGLPMLVQDLPITQQAAGAAFHSFQAVGRGVMGTLEGGIRGLQWLGVDAAKPLGDKINEWQTAVAVDPSSIGKSQAFLENLASGLGSAAMFYVPGVGVAKGLKLINGARLFGTYTPRIAMLFGGAVSTALEAMTEAGLSYQEALDAGDNKDLADAKASSVFWANSALIFLTNTLGRFSPAVRTELKTMLLSAPNEAVQEYGQQIISNIAAGRDTYQGAAESGLIGGIIGGLLGADSSMMTQLTASKDQEAIIDQQVIRPDAVKSRLDDVAMKASLLLKGKIDAETEVGNKLLALQEDALKHVDSPGKFYKEVAKVIKESNLSEDNKTKLLSVEQGLAGTVKDFYSQLKIEPGLYEKLEEQKMTYYTEAEEKEAIKSISSKLKISIDRATKTFNILRELIKPKAGKEEEPEIFKDAVAQVELETGKDPEIITSAIQQAQQDILIPADQVAVPDMKVSGKVGERIILAPGEKGEITIRTKDFDLKAIRTPEDRIAYEKDKKKYEGYFEEMPGKEPVVEITDYEKLGKAIKGQQFITTEEAISVSKEFAFIEKLDIPVIAKKKILTQSGQEAFGKYSQMMIEFLENPHKTTIPHEAAHAFMDLMLSPKQKQALLDEVKRRYAGKKYNNLEAEERLAQDFAKYYTVKKAQGKAKAASSKIKQFFDKFIEILNNIFAPEKIDKIQKFYQDIETKAPGFIKSKMIARKIKRDLSDRRALQLEYYLEPNKLTVKFLENVDVKNRQFSSYQFLKNLLKSKSLPLKEAERNLIDDILDTQFKDEKKINMEDFRDAIISELLPLQIIESATYADYGSSNVDRNVDHEYTTLIFNSPFTHGRAGHFQGDFAKDEKAGLFSHARIWEPDLNYVESTDEDKGVVYVAEIQSDIYQEGAPTNLERIRQAEKELINMKEDLVAIEKEKAEDPERADISEDRVYSIKKVIAEQNNKIYKLKKADISKEEKAFDSYRNIWHERTIRELIRIAAMRGVKKLRFPTPYTISKIEGYLDEAGQISEDIDEGEEFEYLGDDYILLRKDESALSGEATPVGNIQSIVDYDEARNEEFNYVWDDLREQTSDNEYSITTHSSYNVEELEKIKIENENKFENIIEDIANKVIDSRYANAESYALYYNEDVDEDLYFSVGDKIIITKETSNIETLGIGATEQDKKDFDYTELEVQEQRTVNEFYHKKVGRYLTKLKKNNSRFVEDHLGYDWLEVDITPEDKEAVEAFQTKESLEKDDKIYSGEKIAEIYKSNEDYRFEDADEFIKKLINSNDYKLVKLKIEDLLKEDKELKDYVDNYSGVILKKTTFEDKSYTDDYIPMGLRPIITGFYPDSDKISLFQGHNNIIHFINNGYKYIDAYIPIVQEAKYQVIPPSKIADLEYRREQDRIAREQEEFEADQNILFAREENLVFLNSEMEDGYQNFKKLANRRKWLLDPGTDDKVIKRKIKNINIDNHLFQGSSNKYSNDDLLVMFKERYEQEITLKVIAEQKTIEEMKVEQKKAIQNIVKEYRVGKTKRLKQVIIEQTGIRKPEKITMTERQLLRKKIADISRGTIIGRQSMRKVLVDAFRNKFKEQKEIREAMIKFADDLPANERGKLLPMINNAKTQKDLAKAFIRIDARLQVVDKKEQLQELKKIAQLTGKAVKTGKGVAIDYQRKVMDILSDYNLTRPTKKTISKLRSLRDYIKQDGDTFIPDHLIKKLDTLSRKNIADMDASDVKGLNDLLNRLLALGNLKLQLKNKYDDRQRQVALNKLVDSTVNLDPKGDITDKKYAKKEAAKKSRLNVLHSFRVTDKMDGMQDYRGENTLIQQKISKKVSNAEISATSLLKATLGQISDIKDDWSEDEQAIMEFHLLKAMRATTQAQQLVYKVGWDKEPELTSEMEIAMDIMRGAFQKNEDYLTAIYEEINNKPFEKINNYFPLKYEKKAGEIPEPTIGQQFPRTTKTQQGFTFQRMKNVKRVPRADVFAQFEEAIREQHYYMQVQPVLIEAKQLINDEAYKAKAGRITINWWRDYIDGIANHGSLSRAEHHAWLAGIRINLSRAILGYKLSSMLIQPMAIFDALAYTELRFGTIATGKMLGYFTTTWLRPGYAKKIRQQSIALQLRDGGELAIEEIEREAAGKGVYKKFQKGSLAALKWADIKTAAGVDQAFYNILRKEGLEDAEARSEADMLMNIVSGSSEIADRPLVLMKGEAMRTLFTFQTFLLNRWGLISHDIFASGIIKGTLDRKARALLAIAILSIGNAVEEEMRKWVFSLVKGRKYDDKFSMLKSALFTIPESVPILGQMLKGTLQYNQGYSIPITRVLENFIKGGTMLFSKKESTQKRGALKITEALATFKGIPGTAQVFDIAERFIIPPKKKSKARSVDQMFMDLPSNLPRLNLPKSIY